MSERSPFRIERCVQPDVGGVERRQRLDHVQGQSGRGRELLRRRLPPQLLPQCLGGPDDPGEVGRAVQGHADGSPLARERGEDGLADPPDRVGDELHALVGIELPGGGQQADVALADQVGECHAAVLIFLGDGDDESQVALHQLLHRLLVARADPAGDGDLLLGAEQGRLADFVQVLVEDVPIAVVYAEGLGRLRLAGLARLWPGGLRQDLGRGEVRRQRLRGGVSGTLGGTLGRLLPAGLLLAHGRSISSSGHRGCA